jgi:hypothetical protein
MPKKRGTTDQFIRRARQVHGVDTYNYDQVEYKLARSKVIITCKTHGPFQQTPDAHLSGKGCTLCGYASNKAKQQMGSAEFISRASKKHGNFYDYRLVEYVNNATIVAIVCPKHGKFEQSPSNHLNGNGCPKCSSLLRRCSQDDWIAKAKNVHGDRYDYSQVAYTIDTAHVSIGCQIHGYFSQTPTSHVHGRSGCPKCNPGGGTPPALTLEEWIQRAVQKHGDKYDYGQVEYVNYFGAVTIRCPSHGDFQQRAGRHLDGHGCRACSLERSKLTFSKVSLEWLNHEAKRRNISIQHALNGGERWVRGPTGENYFVDGFCDATNQAFEFHGTFWHAHPAYYKDRSARHPGHLQKTFEEVYQRTLLREAHIRLKHQLIVMWEHDWRRIKDSAAAGTPVTKEESSVEL